jgi:hypothetical protein
MKSMVAILALLAGLAASPALAQDPVRATAEVLRDRALEDPTAYAFVTDVSTQLGPRLVGAAGQKASVAWGEARLKALGFQNVHAEPFLTKAWLRGPESAQIVAPRVQALHILGLGGSVATPPEGVEGEVVVFGSYADMLAQPPGSLAGKIAVVDQPMVRTQDGSGYGSARFIRSDGASQAARRGAVAYLIRSLDTHESRAPHTGGMTYADGAPRIPCAALSTEDADLLARMARTKGAPVRLRLQMQSTYLPAAQAWNIVGEVTGRETPDEVIVIGGHMDSWDPGTGSIDDGAGMAITVAAAKLIADLPTHPRRTIRVVLFGAEEFGDAGEAYAAAHKDEIPKIVLAAESDDGGDSIWSAQAPPGSLASGAFQSLGAILAPLKIDIAREPARGSGEDVAALDAAGVPAFAFHNDVSRYFQWHHSADDTLDKIDRDQLNQNVGAWAAMLWLAAESQTDFRAGR